MTPKKAPKGKVKPFRLEVGKTYVTRDRKNHILIRSMDSFMRDAGTPVSGEILRGYMSMPYWTEAGSYFGSGNKSDHDLVKLAPTPKQRKAK